jgi:hypothetical protein
LCSFPDPVIISFFSYKGALLSGLVDKDLGLVMQEAAASQAETKFKKAEDYNKAMRIRSEGIT